MTQEWIEWNGGEMPVSGDTVVEYKTSIGRTIHTNEARYVHWNHDFYRPAIAAYRIVQPSPAPTDAPKTLWDEYRMAVITGLLARPNGERMDWHDILKTSISYADHCMKDRPRMKP